MSCPDAEQLEQFANNQLLEDVRSSVASHVSTCRECGALVAEFRENQPVLEELARLTPDTIQRTTSDPVPTDIPGFRIVRELGHGGMGVVYEAEQEEPRRRVALKIVRGGEYVTQEHVRLFQREVRALARLKHPGIATIYEAGRTATGQPFFAMELVKGTPLNRFVVERRISKRKRLELFSTICDAINYAHQRGVVHRDLKPSNVLIDEEGKPKILDFGLARITDTDISLTTVTTEVGKIKGTLPYMSPEQARGNPVEIDLRSDVYSLGIVLYELMTDQLPYDINRTLIPEALRVICEETPRKPSAINRTLRGDLETIVLKALEKDPDRRYQSAALFGEDIDRYLSSQPILARPPSTTYQLRKLVSRHKVPSALLATILLLLTSFSVGMTLLFRDAQLEAEKAKQIQSFLEEMLGSIDPEIAKGRDTPVLQELLDDASRKVGTGLIDQPEVEAAVRRTIGNVYVSIGMSDKAEPHLQTALRIRRELFGEEHPDIAESMCDWVRLLIQENKLDGADRIAQDVLTMRRRLFAEDGAETAEALGLLAEVNLELGRFDEAELYIKQALALNRALFGDLHRAVAGNLHELTAVRMGRRGPGDFAAAISTGRDAVELFRQLYGREHVTVANSLGHLGIALYYNKNYQAAEPILREALAMNEKLLGEKHPQTIGSMNNLGDCLSLKGETDAAEVHLLRALELKRQTLGENNSTVGVAMMNLSWMYEHGKGDLEKAEDYLRNGIAIFRKGVDEDHFWVTNALANHAKLLHKLGRYADELKVLKEVRERYSRAPPPDPTGKHSAMLDCLYGRCLAALNRYDEAEPFLLDGHNRLVKALGLADERSQSTVQWLIDFYLARDAAEPGKGYADKAAEFRAMLITKEPPTPKTSEDTAAPSQKDD